MKEFFNKYQDKLTERHALKFIHCLLHKVKDEHKAGKDYIPSLKEMHVMIGDLIASKASQR